MVHVLEVFRNNMFHWVTQLFSVIVGAEPLGYSRVWGHFQQHTEHVEGLPVMLTLVTLEVPTALSGGNCQTGYKAIFWQSP